MWPSLDSIPRPLVYSRSASPLYRGGFERVGIVFRWLICFRISTSALYDLITESTPPPRQLPYPHQTPISFNTGSFVNTSENRKHFNGALRDELDSSLYINVPGFFDAFFDNVANLTSVADAVFRKCQGGKDPLYTEEGGWRDKVHCNGGAWGGGLMKTTF
jgi:hypothetical protein